MKITLIAPPFPFARIPIVPPILEYLGALTQREQPDAEIELLNPNVREPDPELIEADLVGISAITPTAAWTYDLADRLRERGQKVVLGGIHPSALPEEALEHADAVVVGEAESVWGQVLRDLAGGTMEGRYDGERLPLDQMPMPMREAQEGPYRFRALFTMRGCPYRCTFCSVRTFFGDTMRFRPIDDVVREVSEYTGKVFFNGDDNIWAGPPQRAIDLFNALRGTKRRWYGFGDMHTVQGKRGDEILRSAADAGLFSIWLGWESSHAASLAEMKALTKQGKDREAAVQRIKDHGIDVTLFVMLGARDNDPNEFDELLELSERLGVAVHPVLLTPLPGTELFEAYRPYLRKDRDWRHYTGARIVYEHPTMSPVEIERRFYEMSLKLMGHRRSWQRMFEMPKRGFPATHLLAMMKQIPMRRAMQKAYADWQREVAAEGVEAP